MSSAEQQMSANMPAPKTFAPSREDVLSTLGFFFGDPGTRSRPVGTTKRHGALCTEVFVKLLYRFDLCLALVCRVSFVTAVPEKLKDYSEHHAMYAHRANAPLRGSASCTVPKKLTRDSARFFHSQDLPLPGWCASMLDCRHYPRAHTHKLTHTQTHPRPRLPPRILPEQPSTARTRARAEPE